MAGGEFLRWALRRAREEPDLIPRYLYAHAAKRIKGYATRRRLARPIGLLRQLVESTPPVPVGPAEVGPRVHTLCGRHTVVDAVASLKTFLRFSRRPLPLVVHEDGSFRPGDLEFFERHFPGVRVVRRSEADREMTTLLRDLPRCQKLRKSFVFGLKYFDLQHYSAGRPTLYVDSDILCFSTPTAIWEALEAEGGQWVNRYNEDVDDYFSWSRTKVERLTGVAVSIRALNAGLLCFKIAEPDWRLAELLLSLPQRDFWTEQSLWSVDFSVRGGAPFPPEYDVSFRHAWKGSDREEMLRGRSHGRPVVTEHYCGGPAYRTLYYEAAHALCRAGLRGA
jgi:hypothetical protein